MSVPNCPQCGATVAEGVSICPACDHILDDSFLSADPPEFDDPPPRPATRSRPGVRKTGARPAVKRATGARPAVHDATQIRSIDEIRPPSGGWGETAETAVPMVTTGSNHMDAGDLLADAKAFLGDLGTADKLAFIGSALTALATFFPWKETAEDGEVIGFMSLGIVSFVLAAVAMFAVASRVRRSLLHLSPALPWLVQFASVGIGLVWCFVYARLSWDGTQVPARFGVELVSVSKPAAGVFIAILTQIVALGGTLMGLKERPV